MRSPSEAATGGLRELSTTVSPRNRDTTAGATRPSSGSTPSLLWTWLTYTGSGWVSAPSTTSSAVRSLATLPISMPNPTFATTSAAE